MGNRGRVSLASLLTIASGGVLLSTPPQARAEVRYDCVESIRGYCEYLASFCSSQAIRCYYTTVPCEIVGTKCIDAVDVPPAG